MSLADKTYIKMCEQIINNGCSTQGEKVRPVWPDTNEKAYTMKSFGICNRYDLREEFPVITLRPISLKSAFDEILWIYQKKSNKVSELNSHIWDAWADENGTIGTAYGHQIGELFIHHSLKNGQTEDSSDYPSYTISKSRPTFSNSSPSNVLMDQMDAVLYDLKKNPFSRRIMTNMYNFSELHSMGLQPCAYSTTWNVTDEGYDKPVLNMILNQRSQDVLTAGSWNPAQYALLLMMVAQVVDMIPGELLHVIADAHIYDRHIPIIKEMITREQFEAPIVELDPDIKSFYDFTIDSLTIKDYKAGEPIKNIPVAV